MAAEGPLRQLAAILGADNAADGLYSLARRIGAPRGLKELGMGPESIDRATDVAMAKPYWNPRPLERSAIRELIARAYEGEPPTTPGS
jgi:maleylacetate reductase